MIWSQVCGVPHELAIFPIFEVPAELKIKGEI